jgi:hypothetical protein
MAFSDFFRRKKKSPVKGFGQAKNPTAEAARHCFVLCASAEPGDLHEASQTVSEIFGPDVTCDAQDGRCVVIMRGEQMIGVLAHMPAPIPEGEAEHHADGNFLWPEGKEIASQHRSHVIVTTMGGQEEPPVDAALTLTRLALVGLRLFDGLGVYWGNASVSNSREAFENFCEDLSEDSLPVPMWLRFQLVKAEEDEFGIYTLGMQQFGLMDIEVDQSTMEIGDLFSFVSNIAHYLIKNGPVIGDGNTVGGNEEEKIIVRHRPSMVDGNRRVYKILME